MHVAGGAGASLIEKVKVRSGLAGGGNRLRTIGPSRKESRFRALITRNSLTITPPHFRLGSIPYASRESREQQRDFRPSRRRGFDDDNFETPRRSFGAASGSNAQRFEAPSGPPVQAVVKWYNPDKGFGFVQLADGSGDAFLHVSVVERSGHGSVPPGATLEVRAGTGPKGPQVSEILSVDSSTAQQEPPRRARPERPMYPPADRAAVEEFRHGQVVQRHEGVWLYRLRSGRQGYLCARFGAGARGDRGPASSSPTTCRLARFTDRNGPETGRTTPSRRYS